MEATTYRQRVDALPDALTPAIHAAVDNAHDLGMTEDDDAFWAEVYGQVMETVAPETL